MLGLNEYAKAFADGLNYSLFGSNIKEPVLDTTKIESIGYYDGYNYGEYCKITDQHMGISNEKLITEIDKRHTTAINKYSDQLGFTNKDQVK